MQNLNRLTPYMFMAPAAVVMAVGVVISHWLYGIRLVFRLGTLAADWRGGICRVKKLYIVIKRPQF